MRKVFADTLYWIALIKPNDPYVNAAKQARQAIGPCIVFTTDEVLYETVNAFARGGPNLREKVAQVVRELFDSPDVKVVPQSRDSFLRGLDRFSRRIDKEYSLTDCSSMNVMDAESIKDVLTNDHHFAQEGYNVLIRRAKDKTAQ
jgi:uncharacterized protein